MATLEEPYGKVMADEAESEAWERAQGEPGGVAAFLAERGCDATPQQAAEFLRARLAREGELADEELDSVAGGCGPKHDSTQCLICGDWYTTYHTCKVICTNCGTEFWYESTPGLVLACPGCGEVTGLASAYGARF